MHAVDIILGVVVCLHLDGWTAANHLAELLDMEGANMAKTLAMQIAKMAPMGPKTHLTNPVVPRGLDIHVHLTVGH